MPPVILPTHPLLQSSAATPALLLGLHISETPQQALPHPSGHCHSLLHTHTLKHRQPSCPVLIPCHTPCRPSSTPKLCRAICLPINIPCGLCRDPVSPKELTASSSIHYQGNICCPLSQSSPHRHIALCSHRLLKLLSLSSHSHRSLCSLRICILFPKPKPLYPLLYTHTHQPYTMQTEKGRQQPHLLATSKLNYPYIYSSIVPTPCPSPTSPQPDFFHPLTSQLPKDQLSRHSTCRSTSQDIHLCPQIIASIIIAPNTALQHYSPYPTALSHSLQTQSCPSCDPKVSLLALRIHHSPTASHPPTPSTALQPPTPQPSFLCPKVLFLAQQSPNTAL